MRSTGLPEERRTLRRSVQPQPHYAGRKRQPAGLQTQLTSIATPGILALRDEHRQLAIGYWHLNMAVGSIYERVLAFHGTNAKLKTHVINELGDWEEHHGKEPFQHFTLSL